MLCMGAAKSHVTKPGHVIAPKTETVVRGAVLIRVYKIRNNGYGQ